MNLTLLTPPVSEPLTLADIKQWLRIDGADEDALLASLLATARATIERETRHCLMPQAWRLTLDAWPFDGIVQLPLAPVRGVLGFRVLTGEGYVTVPETSYRTDFARAQPRIWITGPVPYPGVGGAGIEIELECGYSTAGNVPEPLRHAIRQLAARLYEHRGDGAVDIAALPPAISRQLSGFRRPRLA